MKCIIIDSSKAFRNLFGHVASKRGFECLQASSGREGLKIIEEDSVDVIFVSMVLSDMDGGEFTGYVRGAANVDNIPIIMITSTEEKDQLDRAILLGVTDVFSKKEMDKLDDFLFQFLMKHNASDTVSGRVLYVELYVEDSRAIAAKTKTLLEMQGLSVDQFYTAEEALEAYKTKDYDLVLTDVVLEGRMSGYALLRSIRGLGDDKARVPILVMSGFNDNARKIELLTSGANDYVSKPALDEELVARVKNYIHSKKRLDLVEAQAARLQSLAMKDQLTGLYNRHYLMEVMPGKLSESRRHDFPCSLIVIDADKFKHVNDTYGHATGDIVLKELGKVVQDAIRCEDFAARIGGEEFVIFMANCDGNNAALKAEKIRQQIEMLCPANLDITASFGVAEYDCAAEHEFNDLFQIADKVVYVAKTLGEIWLCSVSQKNAPFKMSRSDVPELKMLSVFADGFCCCAYFIRSMFNGFEHRGANCRFNH